MNLVAIGKGLLTTLVVYIAIQVIGFASVWLAMTMHAPEPLLAQLVLINVLAVFVVCALVTGYSIAKADPNPSVLVAALAAGTVQLVLLILNHWVTGYRPVPAIAILSVMLAMVLGIVGSSFRIWISARVRRDASRGMAE